MNFIWEHFHLTFCLRLSAKSTVWMGKKKKKNRFFFKVIWCCLPHLWKCCVSPSEMFVFGNVRLFNCISVVFLKKNEWNDHWPHQLPFPSIYLCMEHPVLLNDVCGKCVHKTKNPKLLGVSCGGNYTVRVFDEEMDQQWFPPKFCCPSCRVLSVDCNNLGAWGPIELFISFIPWNILKDRPFSF